MLIIMENNADENDLKRVLERLAECNLEPEI